MDIKKEINDIVDPIAGELKSLAQKYGAWIVLLLVLGLIWKKIK